MSRYAWVLTKDHLFTPGDSALGHDDAGLMGPSGITPEQEARLKAGEGHPFRMRDDDGELYYEGRLIGDKDSEDGFGPLWDYGTPGAGCTSIEYKEGNAWKAL